MPDWQTDKPTEERKTDRGDQTERERGGRKERERGREGRSDAEREWTRVWVESEVCVGLLRLGSVLVRWTGKVRQGVMWHGAGRGTAVGHQWAPGVAVAGRDGRGDGARLLAIASCCYRCSFGSQWRWRWAKAAGFPNPTVGLLGPHSSVLEVAVRPVCGSLCCLGPCQHLGCSAQSVGDSAVFPF